MVERPAVNRQVAGSSPAQGVNSASQGVVSGGDVRFSEKSARATFPKNRIILRHATLMRSAYLILATVAVSFPPQGFAWLPLLLPILWVVLSLEFESTPKEVCRDFLFENKDFSRTCKPKESQSYLQKFRNAASEVKNDAA